MKKFPSKFAAGTRPIPPGLLSEADARYVRLLTDKGYEIRMGLTPELTEQVLAMSREPAIREYCPRDSAERFADRTAAEQWLAKGRSVFLLFKKAADGSLTLAGYGWSGGASASAAPGGETTFALRIGEIGHGQGLAAPFSWLIIIISAALYGCRNFWLETWASNGAAVHIYHKIGFQTVTEKPGRRFAAAGGKTDDTRVYMLLPGDLLPG